MMDEYKKTRRMGEQGGAGHQDPYAAPDVGYAPRRIKTEVLDTEMKPGLYAWLVIVDGARAGKLFVLQSEITIGRDGNLCDIVLEDPAVSNQHAKVKAEKDKEGQDLFFLYDLASQNKTFVNDQEILKQELKDGDRVQIGRVTMVFKKV